MAPRPLQTGFEAAKLFLTPLERLNNDLMV